MSDYIIKYDSDGSQKRKWRQVEELGLDLELVKDYEKIISERSDCLIWAGSKDGRYSVNKDTRYW